MRFKLSELIEQVDLRNFDEIYGLSDVKGISIQKEFIETKAKMEGVSLKPYKIVEPDSFAYVTVTSRNGDKITIAYNDTKNTYIVSSSYIVFRVKNSDILSSKFLFMYFNRSEFDRFARYNSWGSARETFSWNDMCDIEIDLPSISIQNKYVEVYQSILRNQQVYDNGLEDLKLVCDATIEKLRREMPVEAIGKYIERQNNRNINDNRHVLGLSTKKEFREPSSKVNKSKLTSYKIVEENWFAYVPTTDTWKVFAFGLNKGNGQIIVSPIYEVFSIIDETKLRPEYLAMWFKREEFDRFVRFNSWGSARENYKFIDLEQVKIPIPDIAIQQSVVDIYNAYISRKEINEKLKQQIKDICPVLIAGAIKESNDNG